VIDSIIKLIVAIVSLIILCACAWLATQVGYLGWLILLLWFLNDLKDKK